MSQLCAREIVVPARAPCVCRRCSASPAPRAAIYLRPLGANSRNPGSAEQAHDVNALSMLWDAKVCRVEYFESADPAIWRSRCKMFSKVARCCVAKPLTSERMPVGVWRPTRRYAIDDQPAALGSTHPVPSAHRRERLARKTSNIKIMVWEPPWWPTAYVPEHLFGSGGPRVAQANHAAAEGVNFARGRHLTLARQPKSVKHVGKRF